jgi:DNA-binding NtrC family response regulator
VRGAFPGAVDTKVGLVERAHEGTLLLDRVGELPAPIQSKLLRAVEQGEIQRAGTLETRHVDVRVIATTTRDLRTDVAASRFRPDLFQLLSAVHLHVPPLRERREDIPYLTAAFVQDASQRAGRPIASIAPAAARRLQDAYWPGNVRELRNVIEQACVLGDGATLSARDVEAGMGATGTSAKPEPSASKGIVTSGVAPAGGVPDLLTTAQRDQIARVLREEGGNKASAAKRLGVSRRSLYRWIARLDIKV